MFNAQPSTLLGSIFVGATALFAEVVPMLGPEKMVANLGVVGVLIWLIVRQDARQQKDKEKCDREIADLRAQVDALRTSREGPPHAYRDAVALPARTGERPTPSAHPDHPGAD